MIITKLKESDSIEKALKKFKRKVKETKMIEELREREQFLKPSVTKRKEKLKDVYKQRKQRFKEHNT